MSKKNNIFSKDFKYDYHILMIVGIIIVIVGVLTAIDIINFEEEINGEIQNNNSLVGIFLIVVGIGSIIISYFKLKKKKELKEKSIYYKVYKDYKNNKIKTDLQSLGLETDNISLEETEYSLIIGYRIENGSFQLIVNEEFVEVGYYYDEEVYDQEDESLTNEELENAYLEFDACKVDRNTIYKKYIEFINQYKHLAK